jgi:D-alanine-D-alanine ligase
MTAHKLTVGVLFGGKSPEHDVSVMSARNIVAALNKAKYNVKEILVPRAGPFPLDQLTGLHVVIPAIHGATGEDGALQGLLTMLDIPFVGCDILGSAIGMDKEVAKRLLQQAGIQVAPYLVYRSYERSHISFPALAAHFGTPFFVKAASLGSSLGVHKVTDAAELQAALDDIFTLDSKALIEQAIIGREIECAVLGADDHIQASTPGEILTTAHNRLYSFADKYLDTANSSVRIPAPLTPGQTTRIQELSLKTFHTLYGHGLTRVDMFLTPDDQLIINEINTFPGFTNNSMYPKLWELDGKPIDLLLDELINLALTRHRTTGAHEHL